MRNLPLTAAILTLLITFTACTGSATIFKPVCTYATEICRYTQAICALAQDTTHNPAKYSQIQALSDSLKASVDALNKATLP